MFREEYLKIFPRDTLITKDMIMPSLETLTTIGLPIEKHANDYRFSKEYPTPSRYPVTGRIKQLNDWIYMLDCKLRIQDLGLHFTLVNGKYIYSHKTGKWRVKGRGKWYRSKDLDTFIFKYVYSVVEENDNA